MVSKIDGECKLTSVWCFRSVLLALGGWTFSVKG